MNRATAIEREWMGRVARLQCVLCVRIGLPQETRTTVHHLEEGTGIGHIGQRSPHFLTVALCEAHHLGALGINGLGSKEFERRYDVRELQLLDDTIEGVFRGLTRQVCRPAESIWNEARKLAEVLFPDQPSRTDVVAASIYTLISKVGGA